MEEKEIKQLDENIGTEQAASGFLQDNVKEDSNVDGGQSAEQETNAEQEADKKNENNLNQAAQQDVKQDSQQTTFSQMEIELSQLSDEEKAKLDASQQVVAKRKGKNKKWLNILMFLLNVAIVVGIFLYQFLKNEFVPISDLTINIEFIFVCFALFFVALFFDTWSTEYLTRKAAKRRSWVLSFKTTICGRYYDAVTPLSTGGQPFQLTYLMNRGIPSSAALSIPIAKLFFFQLAWFVISCVCLIVSFVDKSFNSFVNIASIIGFVLGFAVMFFTLFLSVSKNVGKKLVAKTLKLLQKMKIIKNYEKQYQRVINYVEDYQNIMRQYVKSPKDFIMEFTLAMLRTIAVYSLPFFIYCTFNGFSTGVYFKLLVMGVLVDLASSFIPLPGGSGMNEVSFSLMFGLYFESGPLFWAMLLWRFFTYYIYLILGLGMIIYDVSYGNRKYRWLKVERQLQEESKTFKDQQIANFKKERAYRRKRQLK